VVFEVVSREVSGLEVELLVVGLDRQQVVSLLGILPLEFTTGMGGVLALRRRGGTVHGLSSVVLVLLQAARGGFLGVVTEVVFVVVAMVGKMA
jgi:nicotinamide riboside transporter PnuC